MLASFLLSTENEDDVYMLAQAYFLAKEHRSHKPNPNRHNNASMFARLKVSSPVRVTIVSIHQQASSSHFEAARRVVT